MLQNFVREALAKGGVPYTAARTPGGAGLASMVLPLAYLVFLYFSVKRGWVLGGGRGVWGWGGYSDVIGRSKQSSQNEASIIYLYFAWNQTNEYSVGFDFNSNLQEKKGKNEENRWKNRLKIGHHL